MIHDFTMTKYHNHPSKLILKHENVLSKGIILHDVNLYQITLYNKCTVIKSTYAK